MKKLVLSLLLASASTVAVADEVVQGSGAFLEPGVTYQMNSGATDSLNS